MGVTRRVTLRDAAMILGISKEAVRKRVQRGTLRSEMGADGRRYVYLDEAKPGGDTVPPEREPGEHDRGEASDVLVDTLREQLAAEREANRENRRIIAALTQRIPALESPEPRDAPENAAEPRPPTETPASDTGQPRTPWWRRFFWFE